MTKLSSIVHLALGASVAAAAYEHTITRDVVVIGGGSGGTYASIRLQQLGHSVALVEKTGRLGGHVNTFVDPKTKATFDFGVIVFENLTTTVDYMKHLDVDIVDASFASPPDTVSGYANLRTGGKITTDVPASIPWANNTAVGLALAKFIDLFNKDFAYVTNGFNLPDPVPEDLTMPFGSFLDKYDLGPMVFAAASVSQGVGNVLDLPTLYVLKYYDSNIAAASIGTGPALVTTADSDNQGIYDKALAKLGSSNVLLKSTVTKIDRQAADGGVEVSVDTAAGRTLIKAKKLVIATPPELKRLQQLTLKLDDEEQQVFGKLNHSYYWDMVISNSGIPDNYAGITPIDFKAPFGIAARPSIEALSAAPVAGLSNGYYSSPHPLTNKEVQQAVLANLAELAKTNGFNTTGTPEFAAFHNHSPFLARVSAEELKGGFYKKMNALQGKSNTFYTGAAWQTENSAQIWNWSEGYMLPPLLKALKACE